MRQQTGAYVEESAKAGRRASERPKPRCETRRTSLLRRRASQGQFRYGKIVAQESNKLEIEFEHAGLKKLLDSFVSAG